MGSAPSFVLCSSNNSSISHPSPPSQSLYCHHCRGVISSGPSAFLAGQGRFGVNGAGVAECPRCRGNFVEVLTEHERRRIQINSPLRQVRVAATNIMPGRRVTANDIVYTFFLFDSDINREFMRDSDLEAAISQSLDEAAGSPQKSTSKRFLEGIQKAGDTVAPSDIVRQEVCPICEETLEDGEGILRLPCSHVFHDDCICPWLKHHNTCPICRNELPAECDDLDCKSQRTSSNLTETSISMQVAAAAARINFAQLLQQQEDARGMNRAPTPVLEAAQVMDLNEGSISLGSNQQDDEGMSEDYHEIVSGYVMSATSQDESGSRCPEVTSVRSWDISADEDTRLEALNEIEAEEMCMQDETTAEESLQANAEEEETISTARLDELYNQVTGRCIDDDLRLDDHGEAGWQRSA
eukprot:749461-Hanusia_phi.AAC.1